LFRSSDKLVCLIQESLQICDQALRMCLVRLENQFEPLKGTVPEQLVGAVVRQELALGGAQYLFLGLAMKLSQLLKVHLHILWILILCSLIHVVDELLVLSSKTMLLNEVLQETAEVNKLSYLHSRISRCDGVSWCGQLDLCGPE